MREFRNSYAGIVLQAWPEILIQLEDLVVWAKITKKKTDKIKDKFVKGANL